MRRLGLMGGLSPMSRSRRKTPICGFASAESEKRDKQRWHSKMRSKERSRLRSDPEGLPVIRNEVSSVAMMDKDGKHYMRRPEPRWMRK